MLNSVEWEQNEEGHGGGGSEDGLLMQEGLFDVNGGMKYKLELCPH